MFQRDYVIPTTNYPLLKCSGCSKRIAKSGLQAHTARPRPHNQSACHVCMRRPKSCLAVQIRASRVLNEGATAKQKQEGRTERMQNTQCFSCTRWNDEGCRSCTGRRRNRLLGVWQPGGLFLFLPTGSRRLSVHWQSHLRLDRLRFFFLASAGPGPWSDVGEGRSPSSPPASSSQFPCQQ